jgi:hypothetical protein
VVAEYRKRDADAWQFGRRHQRKDSHMADSIEIKNNRERIETVWKERTGPVDLSRYGEIDIERLMYEALQDYAYHRQCARKLHNAFVGLRHQMDPKWQAVEQHVEHHREKLEQARDRIRRYAKRLSP